MPVFRSSMDRCMSLFNAVCDSCRGPRACDSQRTGVWSVRLLVSLMVIVLLLPACKVPLTAVRQENASLVLRNYRSKPVQSANLGKSMLSLHDCRRIALQNSLDMLTAMWDEQVKRSLADSTSMKIYPTIASRYEMTERSGLAFSRSDVIGQEGAYEVIGPGPGTGVTNFSVGRERFARQWQGEVKWSPMDSAMARYLTRVKENDATSAAYQRVRVAQQLTGTVTAAFYRLMALSLAMPKAQALVSNRAAVVNDLQALYDKRLIDGRDLIDARVALANAKQLLTDIRVNTGKQRELLAAAMNVNPDSCYELSGSLEPFPNYCLDPKKLEVAALVNRPEAYQADLTFLSSNDEYRRLIVKCFPRAEGFFGLFRDENKYLLYKNWTDGGLRVTWDLMDFAGNLLECKAAKERIVKTDSERALVSLGIVSQVRLRTLDAIKALETYKKTVAILNEAGKELRLAKDIEEVKDAGARRKVMRIQRQQALCRRLEAETDRFLALGEARAALAELDTAVGSNYPVKAAECPVGTKRGIAPELKKIPGTIVRSTGNLVRGILPW